MSKAYDFLKECGSFFVLTINDDFPAGRPFGAIMEHEGKLYIATNPNNKVHQQLRDHGNMQILAKKEGTRQWLRITGHARECTDLDMKQRMIEACPVLVKHYQSADDPKLLLFAIEILETEFH
ncbi:pyridoxamine 5'-phosphate oxidase family protein [Allobaculum stercoricanis]|uniref:pyridoxamine 5'-phosphate oxidase family protein n=1 Tax=Allobaculum stercoricanis TaxID=174709 RepID=UPI0023F18094|nr:pyridoxamine 5'-phosphate oxidase family protein [Allobaculum stercoricanis]